jgi:hypothetical protein
METSFQKLAFTVLLLGVAVACSVDEEGVTNGNDAFGAGCEARTGDHSDGSACGCTLFRLHPEAPFSDGRLDLDCFCRQFGCLSYEQSTDRGKCSMGSGPVVRTYAGCNLVEVDPGTGYAGTAFTYDGTSHRLLGAYAFSDVAGFDCSGQPVHSLVGGIRPFPDCPDCELTDTAYICQ